MLPQRHCQETSTKLVRYALEKERAPRVFQCPAWVDDFFNYEKVTALVNSQSPDVSAAYEGHVLREICTYKCLLNDHKQPMPLSLLSTSAAKAFVILFFFYNVNFSHVRMHDSLSLKNPDEAIEKLRLSQLRNCALWHGGRTRDWGR